MADTAKSKTTAKPKAAATKAKAPAKAKAASATTAAAAVAEPKAKAAVKVSPKARGDRPKRATGTAPAVDRSERKVREGLVVSTKMQNTVVVEIERRVQHPLYGKVVLRTKRFKAHDVIGCDEGDRVEIMETRPISKQKRWRVTQILGKVK
jgi:small subunit ribosomal protein S17